MSAQTDTPRRQWRLSDPARPGDRLVYAALTAYRTAIRQGRYTQLLEIGGADHLERRMQERDIDPSDVMHTIVAGRICLFPPHARDWIGGGYLLGNVMVYVRAEARPKPGVDFSDLVPIICSAWRIDPLDACRPLTAPLRELAQIGVG